MDIEDKPEDRKKTAILYITSGGFHLAKRLNNLYPDANILKFNSEIIPELWNKCKSLIFIMASGIVVRSIAPLLKDKRSDPAVVVLDEKGKYVISLLSGHLGGANNLTKEIADFLKGEAVITTASDVNNLLAIDLWAKENDLEIDNWDLVPEISTRLINNSAINIYLDKNIDLNLPDEFLRVEDVEKADVIVTNRINPKPQISNINSCLYLRPKNLVIGIGCNSGTSAEEIEEAVIKALDENNLAFSSISSIATIDKKGNEKGLIKFAEKFSLKIKTFMPDELNKVKGVTKSEAVYRATGAKAVAEPAALISAYNNELLVPKQKIRNVTVAVAEQIGKRNNRQIGKIYIVGTGPGSIEHITPYAQKAIRNSDVIVGYDTYLDLISDLIDGKEIISTGMTKEIDRCQIAIEIAMKRKTVAVISGGDPGIYAMAGLVLELLRAQSAEHIPQITNPSLPPLTKSGLGGINSELQTPYSKLIEVEVIPGISALNACASRLGAPLMHDFATISLSDRLTPWDVIEKRLEAAAMADFVIVLYNPKSKGRVDHIARAQEIILKHRHQETPVGIVKGAMREDERIVITDLHNMLLHEIDMQTTVIIGNSKTFTWDNLMITPRGYEKKIHGIY